MTDYKELCAALREEAECERCSGLFCKNGCVYYYSIKALESIDKLKAERDAAMKEIHKHCFNCKYRGKSMADMPCDLCHYHDKWEWVGM